ncbi:MAG: heavy metal translocating P-type ATPase, partial [Eubacterium sp.]|nr:heavy metal translocating P-type ATPase [Eubacterium sp.]
FWCVLALEHEHEHHHHVDACGCGHDHDHEHAHYHVPGHPEDCQCELCLHGGEYCHICGESLANCTCEMPDAKLKKSVFMLENLGCANCAAKMEHKIKGLPGVGYASITYATKQLRLSADDPEALLPQIQQICQSIESEVKVVPTKKATAKDKKAAVASAAQTEAKPAKKKLSADQKALIGLLIGAVLFVLGEICEHVLPAGYSIPVFVIAYIVLGGRIVITAVKNLLKGQIFDENFLMSVATLAAFAIQDYPEAVGVMLFYRIGEYFEDRAVEKSRTQIMDAVDMRPEVVNLLIGDDIQVIDAEDANVGDILLVRPGDRIPLDGVIVEGESRIDTSPVTGEPVPVRAAYGDEVVSGCVNTSGLLKIRVEKVLEESMVTRILDSVENAAASKPKIDRFITRFARIYTPVVVALAVLTAIVPSLVTGNWYYWIYTAITFLVISCPCALVLSVPLAFFSGIGAGSRLGILFKGGVSLEAIKNVKAVVMDKTGTITEGNFVVQQVLPADSMDADTLLSLAASCELASTHPIGNSVLEAAKAKGLDISRPESVKEIAGQGIEAVLDGRTLLCGNKKLLAAHSITPGEHAGHTAGTEVLLAVDGSYAGRLVIADTIKSDAASAIKKIRSLGITTAMLTGDAQASADAVAKATGIDEVHAKLLPGDKLAELKNIRRQHGAVMFVGDGINDAPVLAGADVGAAMGSGADAAIEAADVVFMNSSVEAIPQAIRIGRKTGRIAWQNVIFALIIKVMVMVLGLLGFANMWMAVFADTGVAIICIINAIRILYRK